LIGDTGNQLFEYAFARFLSLENDNETISINDKTFFYFVVGILWPKSLKVTNKLKYFNIQNTVVCNSLFGFINSILPFFHAVLHRHKQEDNQYMSKLFLKMSAKGKYWFADTSCPSYYDFVVPINKTKHLHGAWLSEKYFFKHRDIIREELRVITPISELNKVMLDRIQSCESVAVHFRRGDAIEVKRFAKGLDVCDTNYYLKAMDLIAGKLINPVFFIFSNDLDYVRKNIEFKYPVILVDNNNPGHEDLRLMYNCKHFVIQNSTFSWWGSYLSDNSEKIIVAPNKFIKTFPNKDVFFRDDMILLDV